MKTVIENRNNKFLGYSGKYWVNIQGPSYKKLTRPGKERV